MLSLQNQYSVNTHFLILSHSAIFSLQGVGGAMQLPRGYLQKVYELVRQRGGVCISDEVQTGFGRLGSHFWGFEANGVVPDIGMSRLLVHL